MFLPEKLTKTFVIWSTTFRKSIFRFIRSFLLPYFHVITEIPIAENKFFLNSNVSKPVICHLVERKTNCHHFHCRSVFALSTSFFIFSFIFLLLILLLRCIFKKTWVAVRPDVTVTSKTSLIPSLASVEESPIPRSESTISERRKPESMSSPPACT